MAWHEVTTGGTNDGELFSAPTAQVMLTENARKMPMEAKQKSSPVDYIDRC